MILGGFIVVYKHRDW